MKKYVTPESEIDRFAAEDIITTSGEAGLNVDGGDGGGDE